MRVIFAGTPQAAVPALEAIEASHHEIAVVITRPDAPRGRGQVAVPSPVAARAAHLGLQLIKTTSLREPDVQQQVANAGAECAVIVAYGGLVPPELLNVPRHGWINLHFSLLPAWRGAAPVQHAILAGDDVTGATTFRLTEGVDEGPILGTITEPIGAGDTSGLLLERLAEGGAQLLTHTVDGLERGELVAHEQPSGGVSLAPKLSSDDARIRWSEPALAIERRVRACTPQPGAWTEHRGSRFGVLPVALSSTAEAPSALAPAEMHVTKKHVWVGTGSQPVVLGLVKPAGKREMAAADWARGVRLSSGDVLA